MRNLKEGFLSTTDYLICSSYLRLSTSQNPISQGAQTNYIVP